LASGLLSGSIDRSRHFEAVDHRNYNRQGQAFDRGETFAGVDFELGLELVDDVRRILGVDGAALAPLALRFILMHPAVTCAIPGGKSPAQVEQNLSAADLPALSDAQLAALAALYDQKLRPLVHQLW
jgi:aryl-alcohol dehydrogenase-like predicted oxidoreductase